MRVEIAIVATWLALSAPLTAQVCDETDNLDSCFEKVQMELQRTELEREVDAQTEAAAAAMAERVVGKNTGASDAVTPGTTSVTDFNPLLQMFLTSGDLDGDAGDGQTMAFDLNNFFGLPVEDGYKLQLVARDAQLYGPIKEALSEEVRDERSGELQASLNRFDDLSFVFGYSPMGPRWGRKPALYRGESSALMAGLREKYLREATDRLFQAEERKLSLLQNLPDDELKAVGDERKPFSAIDDTDRRERIIRATEAAARSLVVQVQTFRGALDESGFLHFADLIDNQPQLTVSLEQTSRDPLVGPDELKGKVSYEHGFVNVNDLRNDFCQPLFEPPEEGAEPSHVVLTDSGAERKDGEGDSATLVECYEKYLTPQRLRSLKRGNRLTVSLEYSQVDDYRLDLAGDGASLDLPGDRTIIGSLAYARYLSLTGEGEGNTRLEVNYSYEDVGSDPNRDSRHLATASLSLPVAQGVFFQVGATYASEPRFRGEVAKEINARLGLTYKLVQDQE